MVQSEQDDDERTYGSAIRGTSNNMVVEVEVLVEYSGIELGLPIKPISDPLPPRRWVSCCFHLRSSSHADIVLQKGYEASNFDFDTFKLRVPKW